ncbi:MAG: succinylglutamate desuccinylase/aspartoacylase family protein [Kofleriaceae bacterium]|nr:succinylglutamate desuccinylase/aspartoacylase family protein [Kofleriaceae bacterium]
MMFRRHHLLVSLFILVVGLASPAGAESPYHSHQEINSRLHKLAAMYPSASVRRVGKSSQGREILALEIDADGKLDRDDPVLLVHGGIHGNEWISVEVVLHLAEFALASNSQSDELRIHFVPVINVDGFAARRRKAVDSAGKWYDPNRDFPVPQETKPHKSRALISALRRYAKRGKLVGVLDYHAPAECIMWPWAFSKSQEPPGVEALKVVVEKMARSVGYCFGQTSKVISYRHKATAQDYFANSHGAAAVLMELGHLRGAETDFAPQELIEQERPFSIFLRWLIQRNTN